MCTGQCLAAGWICPVELVPSASHASHWQWLGQVPVVPDTAQSTASINPGARRGTESMWALLTFTAPPLKCKAWELVCTYVVHMAELLHGEFASHFHSTVWLFSLEVHLLCQEQNKFHMALPVLDRQDNGPCALCMFLSTFIWRVCEDIKSLVSIPRAWWSGKCSAVIDIYYLNWLVIV